MSKKILIVDDDPVLTHLLGSYLTGQGYKIILARDGDDALRKLADEYPDLILLDVVMPRVNGYNFLFEIRKIEGMAAIPIIVLTAKPEFMDIFKAEGVKEYLIKPVPHKDLVEKIKKYV